MDDNYCLEQKCTWVRYTRAHSSGLQREICPPPPVSMCSDDGLLDSDTLAFGGFVSAPLADIGAKQFFSPFILWSYGTA